MKICFVVMGFGKKMDYKNSREVDLDKIYNKIIKVLFENELTHYELIRADEIAGSQIIDVDMYTLLMTSDLVIADITTLNPNAIYELGVRHALRPYSTIIMAEEKCEFPFDLTHSRYLKYKEIGENLNETDAQEIRNGLKRFVTASEGNKTDSPFYTYLPHINPPSLSEKAYHEKADKAKQRSETITDLLEKAENFKAQNKFECAIPIWKELKSLLSQNSYVVQQLALSTYKSEVPNKTIALQNALSIINELTPSKSLDIETLGITGAIYKNLYRVNKNYDYLKEAIYYYRKGYIIQDDYYNAENLANCLLLKAAQKGLKDEEITSHRFESKNLREKIIGIIEDELRSGREDFWMYATLSICYFCLGDHENYIRYQDKFYEKCSVDWQKQSYLETINELKAII